MFQISRGTKEILPNSLIFRHSPKHSERKHWEENHADRILDSWRLLSEAQNTSFLLQVLHAALERDRFEQLMMGETSI